jgi:hypothetical protein
MVDVRVGQEDEIDLLRIEGRKATVFLVGRTPALEHAAIDQERKPLTVHPVTRAGHLVGRAVEGEFHACLR